jgi:hypothetical protein
MNHDDFEQKLQCQPLRQVPVEWREEILAATSFASHPNPQASRPSFLSVLLWPNPQAWAGLAVVWILIFAVNFSTHDTSPVVAKKKSPPSSEVIVELRQQRLLLAELIGPRDKSKSDADRSKSPVPQPRSERRFETLTI